MNNPNNAKSELPYIYDTLKNLTILSNISSLLDWDQNTNMPLLAAKGRGEQIKLIESIIHKKWKSKRLIEAYNTARKEQLSQKDYFVLRMFGKELQKKNKLPVTFTERFGMARALSESAWQEAKKNSDFNLFKEHLKGIVNLKREYAQYLDKERTPYDVLLEEYEEGMTSEKLDKIFAYLKQELIFLRKEIIPKQTFIRKPIVKRTEHRTLIEEFIEKKLQIDKNILAINVSMHPFTTRISKNDVRITSRFVSIDSFFSAIHESGHALYELGLPTDYYYTQIYSAPSTGLDESQAILWENNICRNAHFWKGFYKEYKEKTNLTLELEDFLKYINLIKKEQIRVDADEINYILHIIIRYEIERDMINGLLEPIDADKEWNNKCEELLGRKPTIHEGILQDIHWAEGDFGYFPTYAIGMIYASQIYNTMNKQIHADKLLETANYEPILEWLKEHIYSKGYTKPAEELVKEVSGEKLNPKVFIDYLKEKYSKLLLKN